MIISWQLRMITLLVILSSRKRLLFCQYTSPCSSNQMCTCRIEGTRSEVMCIRVPFYTLPGLLPEQYAHIDVMSSNVEVIENDAFGLAQIESIRLMNNQITFIGFRAFSSMETVLRSLDLSYNKLIDFPYKALHGLNCLDWLNLQSNEINTLHSDDEYFRSWSRLRTTLKTLYLSDNDISEVSKNAFNFYEGLTDLNVDSNKLWTLDAHTLPYKLRTLSYCQNYVHQFPVDILERLPNLSRLYARGNYIRQLPLYALKSFKRMDKLDLGENQIEFISGSKLEHNNTRNVLTIRDLHLDSNRIRFVPAHALEGVNVARLYLSRNGLDYIDENAFRDLTNSLEYLDLEHNNLFQIPTALAPLQRLKYLYISSNRINNLTSNSLGNFCASLKAISFSNNQLIGIPKNALQKCNQLVHLNIGYNYLREVHEEDFEIWAGKLETLVLRNNRLSAINPHTFRHASKIRELSLSFNKLVNINEHAFDELKMSLESLEISFGLFQEEFNGDFLRPLTHLFWLALDNNNLNTLTATAFHSLQNLQYLNLDTNAIADVPAGLLTSKSHKHLTDVRLANNHLTIVRTRMFADLPELQNIVLSHNQLRKIETRAFHNLVNAANIVLSDNRLELIDPQAFVNLTNLMRLDLQRNRLSTINLNAFVNVSSPAVPFSLNVSENELREFEVDLRNGSALHLKYLDASANHLQNIPHDLLAFCARSITRLNFNFNRISKINEYAFHNLTQLATLSLSSNKIYIMHKRAFTHSDNLQVLDLSGNRIEELYGETFHATRNLRILNLANNHLRNLPRNLFAKTSLEEVNLAGNLLGVMPSNAITDVGETLRKLDLSNNHIEHLDSTMFTTISSLSNLNLAGNKLTILPDNVFTGVGNLLTLDLSVNPLRANFKELFHYVQKLRYINLAETGLVDVPPLPLPNLVELRLSRNRIEKLSCASVDNLGRLRRLYLDHNRFKTPPNDAWSCLVSLKELDISNNPIKILSKDSFSKLPSLQSLNIQYLKHVERFDVDIFAHNKLLTVLKMDTYPNIVDKTRSYLGKILSTVHSLRTLSVRVVEEKLEEQLNGFFHSKLKEVEITGENLKYIRKGALKGIEKTYDLVLRIRDTKIEDFPVGLFEGIEHVAHLSLDFSRNKLMALPPAVLYSNMTDWENVGTKLLDGGLLLKDNPWSCDCGLVWLGHWLRRWLRETVEIHTFNVINEVQHMENMAREATCLDQKTNRHISIVDLRSEDLSCQASALSGDGTSSHLLGNHLLGCLIKTISAVSLSRFLWTM